MNRRLAVILFLVLSAGCSVPQTREERLDDAIRSIATDWESVERWTIDDGEIVVLRRSSR